MSLPGYPKYTASGFAWLGEVPKHWSVKPLKYLISLRSGGTPSKAREDFWNGSIPWASAKDLKGERISDTEDHISNIAVDEGGLELSPPGSILVLVRGMMLARAFPVVETLSPIAINQDLKAINPKDGSVVGQFLAWALRGTARESLDRCSEAGHGTKALRMEDWLIMPFPVPPIDEQRAITKFLKRETTKIDALVKEQRRLIALLKEKWKAVIHNAVTKGLNPDAPMKDSGIDWLSEVPAHWDVVALKWVVFFQRGHDLPADDRKLGLIPVVSSAGISDYHDTAITTLATIVTGRYGSIGEFHLIEEPCWPLNTALYSISINGACPQFALYMLRNISPLFIMNAVKSAVPGVDRNDVHPLRVALPPLSEQHRIFSFLIAQDAQIEQATKDCEEAIDLLQERRAALISAAVTGKIDVRDCIKVLQPPANCVRVRGLVAAEIIERLAHQATFGRVKLQKIAYLAEAHVGIAELEGTYLREAAGPLDREMIREMEHEANSLAGIRVEQPLGVGSGVVYRLGELHGAHRKDLAALLGNRAAKFDKLIADIGTIDTKGAEAVATLYAVWNDALIDGETPADMEIKLAVLTEWHPEKAKKFRLDELQVWLDWMRRHGLVPTGTGPKTSTGRLFA